MTQQRIQDYGSPIVAQSLKYLTGSITSAGILNGNEFIANSSSVLRINPGACVTNQGVIIIETESKFISITTIGDYTIYYSHTDVNISGGTTANLTKGSGLLTPATVSGCILGYVRYTGGALSPSMFIQAPPLQLGTVVPTNENANWIFPINGQGYVVPQALTSGGTINITSPWTTYIPMGSTIPQPILYANIQNTDIVTGSITMIFPFKVGADPFAILQIILSTDTNAFVTPMFIDSTGSSVILNTGFTGQPNYLLQTVSIPRTTVQTPNTTVYLQLQISLVTGKGARLHCLGLSTYNSPI